MSGNEAHIFVGNATPNESRSNWDLPSGHLDLSIEMVLDGGPDEKLRLWNLFVFICIYLLMVSIPYPFMEIVF
jgi:hypothetical protein